jgi:hypothetical protein
MATVVQFKEKPGQMFGGKGVSVFRPFDRSKPAAKVAGAADPEQPYPIATEVEHALERLNAKMQQSLKDSKDENL